MVIEELRAYGDAEFSGRATDVDPEEGSFAEIARQYGVLAKEVEAVKREIAQLEE